MTSEVFSFTRGRQATYPQLSDSSEIKIVDFSAESLLHFSKSLLSFRIKEFLYFSAMRWEPQTHRSTPRTSKPKKVEKSTELKAPTAGWTLLVEFTLPLTTLMKLATIQQPRFWRISRRISLELANNSITEKQQGKRKYLELVIRAAILWLIISNWWKASWCMLRVCTVVCTFSLCVLTFVFSNGSLPQPASLRGNYSFEFFVCTISTGSWRKIQTQAGKIKLLLGCSNSSWQDKIDDHFVEQGQTRLTLGACIDWIRFTNKFSLSHTKSRLVALQWGKVTAISRADLPRLQ